MEVPMNQLEKYKDLEYGHFRYKPCQNYVETALDAELALLLEKEHLVFVTGKPGSGKTQLIYNYIHKKYASDTSIKAVVENCSVSMEFLNDLKGNSLIISDYFYLDNCAFIIVLDLPFITDRLFDTLRNLIIPEDYRIIITTRTQSYSQISPTLCVDYHSFTELKEIYESALHPNQFTFSGRIVDSFLVKLNNEELNQLFTILDNNVMMISLLSKALYKDALLAKENIPHLTKELLLDTKKWLWYSITLPEIRDPYINTYYGGKKQKLSFISHALALVCKYSFNVYEHWGPILCIWAGNSISKECLETNTTMTAQDIDDAIDIGLLNYTDNDQEFVKMNSLFYELFWLFYIYRANTKYSSNHKKNSIYMTPRFDFELNLEFCIEQLNSIQDTYINSLSSDMSFVDYNAIVIAAINHIHNYLSFGSKDINLTKRKAIFIKWNCYLINLINFYIDRGNTVVAENVLARLFLMVNKHGNELCKPVLLQTVVIDMINNRKQMLQQNEYIDYHTENYSTATINNFYIQAKVHSELLNCFLECTRTFFDDRLNMLNRIAIIDTLNLSYNRNELNKIIQNFSEVLRAYSLSANCNMLHYHQITLLCLNSIYNLNFESFFIATRMFQVYNTVSPPHREIRVKSELQLANCLLTLGLLSYTPYDELHTWQTINQHLDNINHDYLTTMSFDTIMLYFIVRLKYIAYCMFQGASSNIPKMADKELSSFRSSIELQLSITPEYKNKALEKLLQLSSQIGQVIREIDLPG